MTDRNPNRVATIVGAWRAGRRAGDEVIRERTKLVSGWAKLGLSGMVIGTMFTIGWSELREERADRRIREERLAHTFDKLAESIDKLGDAAEQERMEAANLRSEIIHVLGSIAPPRQRSVTVSPVRPAAPSLPKPEFTR